MTELKVKKISIKKLSLPTRLVVNYTQKEIEKTMHVLKLFGEQIPLLIDKNNAVVFGENLFLAATKLGFDKVSVIQIEDLSEKKINAFKIAYKKILSFGEFDINELRVELKELVVNLGFAPYDLGYDTVEFDNLLFVDNSQSDKKCPPEIENIVIPNNVKKIVRLGDLILLGRHKLYCGDSLDSNSYKILMCDEKADIIVTDPPYNVKIQNNVTNQPHHEEFEQASGEMSDLEFENFLNTAFKNAKVYSKENSLHYIFMDWRHSYILQKALLDVFAKLLNICVWDKTKAGLGSFYRSQHEFCFVYQNGNGKYVNNIQLGKNGRNRSNIWQYQGMNISTKQAKKLSKLHPTVKTTAMLIDILLDASSVNEIVLDCFGGSGSTLIAAEECGRCARLIELSPHYCDVIIHRWEELTGKKHEIIQRKDS